MKPPKRIIGSYVPSFFRMELDFPFPSGHLPYLQLNENNLTVFLHEYIHFLQDLSTYTGLNNAYVYSETLHLLVNKIYKYPKGNIKIPIPIDYDQDNVELNRFINIETTSIQDDIPNFFLRNIEAKKIKVPYIFSPIKHLSRIILLGSKGESAIFGSRAIMESMAFLMEFYISRGSTTPPDFPYTSAEMVVDNIFPNFGKDKLRIIALCDASMLFAEPGKIFINALKHFESINFIPDNPNEVIDYFYSQPSVTITGEVSLSDGLLHMGIMVGERLKLYMNHPSFKPFHNVVHQLIGFGISERYNNKYFMLDIARGGYVSNNWYLRNLIARTGTPIIRDGNGDYWIITPNGFHTENYWIEYFPAIEQVFKCLYEGFDCCELFPWCDKSLHVDTDDKCINSPWERCDDKEICPYGLLWRHWNLSMYKPFTR